MYKFFQDNTVDIGVGLMAGVATQTGQHILASGVGTDLQQLPGKFHAGKLIGLSGAATVGLIVMQCHDGVKPCMGATGSAAGGVAGTALCGPACGVGFSIPGATIGHGLYEHPECIAAGPYVGPCGLVAGGTSW